MAQSDSNENNGAGTTPGERYLAKLCRTSFLSLWNHSNPFTDSGKDFEKPTSVGKELCDQLVVFGNHVIIFSDKECEYSAHIDEKVNWARYYKKAIWKSAGQIWQAEKFIREFSSRIYADSKCIQPLQAIIPSSEDIKVHRVLVVHGIKDVCRKITGGNESIAIDTRIIGDSHTSGGNVTPFVFGQINPEKGFVHLFDDISLPAILESLNTISDFVEYLEKKENFLSNKNVKIYSPSELELLADYLRNLDDEERHNFPKLKPNSLVEYLEGDYHELINESGWKRKLFADRISFLWDAVIEHVTKHLLGDTMLFSSDKSFSANELGLRMIAAQNRVERRGLSQKFDEIIRNTLPGQRRNSLSFSEQRPGLCFALMTLLSPEDENVPEEQYREARRYLLEGYCRVVKLKFFGKVKHIVGIATEGGGMHSIDLLYYDCKDTWDEGEKESAEKFQAKFGFLQNTTMKYVQIEEYPSN